MSLFLIAWRSIQQRGLASLLTSLSMALGVMLVVSVLAIHSIVSASFRSNASLGYNMIVGAKGGKLQLTLNTVYYLSQPVENIPYEYYLEYLDRDQRSQLAAELEGIDASRDGEFAPYTAFAIPLCLGDFVGNFRSVGTTPDFLDKLVFGPEGKRKFEFAEGRNFQRYNEEHGFFEAVVGATAARELKIKLQDKIRPNHGDPEAGHIHKNGFTVVGILKPSGTPNDRAVFVNMEGFYLLEGHAKPVKESEREDAHETGNADDRKSEHGDDRTVTSGSEHAHGHDGADEKEHIDSQEGGGEDKHADDRGGKDARGAHAGQGHVGHDHNAREPLSLKQREVTAILVRTRTPAVTPQMKNLINEGKEAQAVLPVLEIFNLFDAIVGPIQSVLLTLTAIICVVSGVSILVSIYNSMSDRRHEIAVMRALGAGRGTVMSIILLEAILLSVVGGAAGWLLAHTLVSLASPAIAARTGVSVHFFDIAPREALLIPALILLAIICGLLPAISAYRVDVSRSLSS